MDKFYLNSDVLLFHNKRGIFPFPGEIKKDFIKRIDPFAEKNDPIVKNKFSFKKIEELFDIAPIWAQFEYTNKGLRLWEAAALEVHGHKYTLKLKKQFERKAKYLGLYHRDEVIAHECCHLGRMHFDEPKYEEIFAYHTSNALRRFLGPLFETPIESLVLMLLLLLSVVSDFTFFIPKTVWVLLKAAPLLYIGYLGGRLFLRYSRFTRCKKKLRMLVKDPSKVLAVMFRMSDNEIDSFSHFSVKEIIAYIHNQDEIRWDIIKKAYCK